MGYGVKQGIVIVGLLLALLAGPVRAQDGPQPATPTSAGYRC